VYDVYRIVDFLLLVKSICIVSAASSISSWRLLPVWCNWRQQFS